MSEEIKKKITELCQLLDREGIEYFITLASLTATDSETIQSNVFLSPEPALFLPASIYKAAEINNQFRDMLLRTVSIFNTHPLPPLTRRTVIPPSC